MGMPVSKLMELSISISPARLSMLCRVGASNFSASASEIPKPDLSTTALPCCAGTPEDFCSGGPVGLDGSIGERLAPGEDVAEEPGVDTCKLMEAESDAVGEAVAAVLHVGELEAEHFPPFVGEKRASSSSSFAGQDSTASGVEKMMCSSPSGATKAAS